MKRLNNSFKELIVGIVTSLIVTIGGTAIQQKGISIELIPTFINVFLIVLILLTLLELKQIILALDRKHESKEKTLIEQFLEVIDEYHFRFLNNDKKKKEIFNYFEEDFRYVRGQNFINIFRDQIKTINFELLTLNDHPFKPFSDLVSENINVKPGIKTISILSHPDNLYNKNDIINRINSIKVDKAETYILPPENINLSILIFDKKYALLYLKPKSSLCCNFSEGFFVTNKRSIDYMINIFNEVLLMSKNFHSNKNESALDIFQGLLQFYTN